MDLCYILVIVVVYSSHGSVLYCSIAIMRLYLFIIQSIDVLQMPVTKTLSDQAGSYLEVITCSVKYLAYHIPLASCFGGYFVTLKICHQHVIVSLT